MYDVARSYAENERHGPFGGYAPDAPKFAWPEAAAVQYDFFGTPVHIPFGVGAGPAPGLPFVQAFWDQGYPIVTYKSVRTSDYPCHEAPNVAWIELDQLDPHKTEEPIVTTERSVGRLALANSFGIPSHSPAVWQPRIAETLRAVPYGHALLVAFQGTDRGEGRQAYIDDHVLGVRLLAETGAKVIEINLSCPNEGSKQLLCHDPTMVLDIVRAVRQVEPDVSLLLKLTHYTDPLLLRELVRLVGPYVQGFTAINTVGARVVKPDGRQAFPGGPERAKPGISGVPIKHLGVETVRQLAALRTELNLPYKIIGLGGIESPADYSDYRAAGADFCMSVTGAIFKPHLLRDIVASLPESA